MLKKIKVNVKVKVLLIVVILLINEALFGVEYFKGFNPNTKSPAYSIGALLKAKYKDGSKWNENYFHEAQFKDQGITIFTNVIFSSAFMGKKGCKLNIIITFDNAEKYTFNKDYGPDEFVFKDDKFGITFGNDACIELVDDHNYKVTLKDAAKNVSLGLTYNLVNPPQIFGDGIVPIDSRNFLSYSQPICGAYVNGTLEYENKTIKLNGRGSVDHDYNKASPIKLPRKLRSFWLYNDKYSINIHTIILTNKEQVDRVTIFKDGLIIKSFLNTGLSVGSIIYDNETKFSYPGRYFINYTDTTGDSINLTIKAMGITDKIMPFSELSPIIHSIVVQTVGEMWAYRFWTNAEIAINIDNKKEIININGICNYVDMAKSN